jgi:pimeloyl-ACP methyl ester carboxylesterase
MEESRVETVTVIAFCGCPGLASDLEVLQKSCDAEKMDVKIRGCASLADAELLVGKKPLFVIGYSRGAWNALQFIFNHPVKGALLISPHWGSPVSKEFRTLVTLPWISDILFRILGPRSIHKMIVASCFPARVPAEYAALEKEYRKPNILRRCFVDPGPNREQINFIETQIQIPVHVLMGACDKESQRAFSVLAREYSFCSRIAEAGHALPWTHPRECALALKKLLEVDL